MIKNTISGRLVKILAAAAVIILFVILYKEDAHAASFTHTHTDSCYKEVSKWCRHTAVDRYSYPMGYCATCGGEKGFVDILYWEHCDRHEVQAVVVGHRQYCATCATYSVYQDPPANMGHYYTDKEVICGMDGSTVIANVSLQPSSTAPANTGVTLTVVVSDAASEFSLAAAPYDFGEGYGTSPSLDVTENGTYSATVMDSKGRTVTVSCEVTSIDKTAPVIDEITKSTDAWTESGLTLTVSAHDEGLGLHGEAYSINGAPFSASASAGVYSNGYISIKVRDAAGNVAETSYYVGNIGRDPKVVEAERKEAERVTAAKAEEERVRAEKLAAEKAAKEKVAKASASGEAKAGAAKSGSAKAGGTTASSAAKAAASQSGKGTGIAGIGKIGDYDEALVKSTIKETLDAAFKVADTVSAEDGKFILINDVTHKNVTEYKTVSDEEIIESINDDDYETDEASGDAPVKVRGISVLKASVGETTIAAGVLFLLAGAFIMSLFSYVYIVRGGKKRIICKCHVVKKDDGITAVVRGEKLKGHGKYFLYISPWKKGFKKKQSVSVMLEGEDHAIPVDEGVAFKY